MLPPIKRTSQDVSAAKGVLNAIASNGAAVGLVILAVMLGLNGASGLVPQLQAHRTIT
jgi:hypothetical protein